MNTGGPAFPITASTGDPRDGVYCETGMTLLDWMAVQLAAAYIGHNGVSGNQDGIAREAYDIASAMLAEKARREEAMRSACEKPGVATAMAVHEAFNKDHSPSPEAALRRLAADVLPADIKDAANDQLPSWCAEQVRARVNTLEAINRELVEALEALLARDQRNTCQHEETHRGGGLWEICDQCGASWADDEGGKPAWSDPPQWIKARAVLAKAKGKA